MTHRPVLFLRDRPEFPFYRTSTSEAAYTQWPLSQHYIRSFWKNLVKEMEAFAVAKKPRPVVVPQAVNLPFYLRAPRPVSNMSITEIDLRISLGIAIERVPWICSIRELEKLVADLRLLASLIQKRWCMVLTESPFQADMALVYNRIEELLPEAFTRPVEPPLERDLLGYTMPAYVASFDMTHDVYIPFVDAWNREDQLTRDELYKELDENACSNAWGQMDVNGKLFGGYWLYPAHSMEFNRAWELSYRANIEALCGLPYPSHAILYAIELGHDNHLESVPYTIMCCEWVRRKMEQMKDCLPLRQWIDAEDDDGRP